MSNIAEYAPNEVKLLMGNEAIARGALEAGVSVAAAYPGTPSTDIIDALAEASKTRDLYVEWSVNEKVALEVAAGASLGGVRALTATKQLGLNVALDFLANVSLTGVRSGLVFVVCDDPGAHSSTNEQDSRNTAKVLDLPLLEPSSPQEAKEMTRWAFELSERISNVCMVRSVTRISHARGNVAMGELPSIVQKAPASFDTTRKPYTTILGGAPLYHKALHENLMMIADLYEGSPFNWYDGPEEPELLIVTCGSGWLYSWEAVKMLSLKGSVGILKLGTTWPLPAGLIRKQMMRSRKILVVEEVDAFLENNLRECATDWADRKEWVFYGKHSGHIQPVGEINTDAVIRALTRIQGAKYVSRDEAYGKKAAEILQRQVAFRETQFCAGCPHRGLFWALKDALKMDGRDGVLTGDIGCYGSGVGSTGYKQLKTMHSMGSGLGVANGLGKLGRFGFEQPVIATCGDSTFFHAAVPALVNGIHSKADFLLLILDNSGTAMTGFQPHPGTGVDAKGESAPAVDIEPLCRSLGVPVEVFDPYDIREATRRLLSTLCRGAGPRVMIARRECALMRARTQGPLYRMRVDAGRCAGEGCGCNRFCIRVFRCPGLIWDAVAKKAEIDQAICAGCGVCVDVCPHSAIQREENR